MPKPIAILIADLHLSLVAPACRADKDWLATQASYLKQVLALARPGLQNTWVPVLAAGDIFDRWNPPPELINFALEHLPDEMICVPGQHDLPNHRMDLMHRSGYGVLKKAGKIIDVSNHGTHVPKGCKLVVYGFGWEEEILMPQRAEGALNIALIHRYVWTIGNSYPGAPESLHLSTAMKDLKGYDVAVFGDNHIPFTKELKNGCYVVNCGTLIRRKSDERIHEPSVWILHDDGTVKRKRLDTSIDRFQEVQGERKETPFNMKDFIDRLEGLGEHGMDFREAVEQHLKSEDIDPKTKEIILTALGDNKA